MMKILKTLTKYIPVLIIFLALYAWFPIFQTFFARDDWHVLQKIVNSNNLTSFLFTPHNEHYTPFFNLLFIVCQKAFGLESIYWILCRIVLFVVSLILILVFLKIYFKDLNIVVLVFSLYALNSIYYEVLGWNMISCFMISFVFILGSIILLEYYLGNKHYIYLIISAIFTLLSALSFSTGILAVPLIIVYYILVKNPFYSITEFRRKITIYLKIAIPYITGFIIYFMSSYYFAFKQIYIRMTNANEYKTTLISLDIFKIIHGLIVMFAQSIIYMIRNSFLYKNNVVKFMQFNSYYLSLVVIIVLMVVIIMFFKSNKNIIKNVKVRLFIFSIIFSSSFYILVLITRMPYGIEYVSTYGRYQYFSLFGIIVCIGIVIEYIINKLLNKKYIKYANILIVLIISLFFVSNKDNIRRNKEFIDSKTELFVKDFKQTFYSKKEHLVLPDASIIMPLFPWEIKYSEIARMQNIYNVEFVGKENNNNGKMKEIFDKYSDIGEFYRKYNIK